MIWQPLPLVCCIFSDNLAEPPPSLCVIMISDHLADPPPPCE